MKLIYIDKDAHKFSYVNAGVVHVHTAINCAKALIQLGYEEHEVVSGMEMLMLTQSDWATFGVNGSFICVGAL